jgi:hypothetical protein
LGLNFHVVCHAHKVCGMVPRGHENEVLHRFYKEHSGCRRWDHQAVEVAGDEPDDHPWMVHPLPEGYTEIDFDHLRPSAMLLETKLRHIFAEASGTLACDAGELLGVIREVEESLQLPPRPDYTKGKR